MQHTLLLLSLLCLCMRCLVQQNQQNVWLKVHRLKSQMPTRQAVQDKIVHLMALQTTTLSPPTSTTSTLTDTDYLKVQLASAQSEIAELRKDLQSLANALNVTQQKKDSPVAFSVFRRTPFTTLGGVITYDGTLVNLGDGMNASTGVFTAPFSGVYYCSASSHLKTSGFDNRIALIVNGQNVAMMAHSVYQTYVTTALSQILNLNQGDRVWLAMFTAEAWDGFSFFATQFNCMLFHKA